MKLNKLFCTIFLLFACNVAFGIDCSKRLVCPPGYESRSGFRLPICKCEKIESILVKNNAENI